MSAVPNLPKSCYATYKEYKTRTQRFLRWMVSRGQELGVTPGHSAANRGTPPPPRGKGQKKGKHSRAPKPPPFDTSNITVRQLVQLAQDIASKSISKVAKEVFDLLDSVVELRKEHAAFYALRAEIPGVKASNERHAFFIEALIEVREALLNSGLVDETVLQVARRFADLSIMSLAGLDEEDGSPPKPDEDEWLPDNLKTKANKGHEEIPASNRPLTDFGFRLDEEESQTAVDSEAQLAAWCLFQDMNNMLKYIQETWEEYRAGQVSLITASFVTTQAVEIVKEMEVDFEASFGSKYAGGEYLRIVQMMVDAPDQGDQALLEVLQDATPPMFEYLMVQPYAALIYFGRVVKANNMVAPFGAKFNPDLDRTAMDHDARQVEDTGLFAAQMPDVACQCLSSSTADEGALIQDTRTFIQDPKRRIPCHLVFQWTCWKAIVHITRHNLDKPLDDLHRSARQMNGAARAWLNDKFQYAPLLKGVERDVTNNILVTNEELILKDHISKWKVHIDDGDAGVPFQLWRYNPWACGIAQSRILFSVHHMAIQVINGSGFLSGTVQLYYALRCYDKIQPWPLLEKLLEVSSPNIYPGGRPVIGQFLLANNISVGKADPGLIKGKPTPGWKEQINGFGFLPGDIGGSLLGRLSETLHYKLDDEIVVELFPRPGDKRDVVKAQPKSRNGKSARPTAAPPPPRFGGKRCDPFTFLAALRARTQAELKSTALTLDLFSAERIAIALFRRWVLQCDSIWQDVIGHSPQSLPEERWTLLAGVAFTAIETPVLTKFDNQAAGLALLDGAAQAMGEVRQEMDKTLLRDGLSKIVFVRV